MQGFVNYTDKSTINTRYSSGFYIIEISAKEPQDKYSQVKKQFIIIKLKFLSSISTFMDNLIITVTKNF